MYDFYASDFGTSVLMHTKHYWQNEKCNSAVIVPDYTVETGNSPFTVYLVQAAPGVDVICSDNANPDVAKIVCTPPDVAIYSKVFYRREGKVLRPENAGRIMNAVFDLIDENSWSFPRAKSDTPYITAAQATLLESNFKLMVNAPNDGTCLYASVSVAGTMLAKRIGVQPDIIYTVKHYDTATNTQVDDGVNIEKSGNVDLKDKTVIVVDDLISSGTTVTNIINEILKEEPKRVYFFALYRTIASLEKHLSDDPRVTIQSGYPLSNAYWVYGRGFDLTDEASRELPDIYGATKHWDWETETDVKELLEFYSANYLPADYHRSED